MSRSFVILWLAQTWMQLGARINGFAFAVLAYQRTQSIVPYTTMLLVANVPPIVLLPFSGGLIDRANRRSLMLAAIGTSNAVTLIAMLFQRAERLDPWLSYLWIGQSTFFCLLYASIFQACIPVLVVRKRYGNASGMARLADGLSTVVAPPIGGWLLTRVALHWLIFIQLAAGVAALLAVIAVRMDGKPPKVQDDPDRSVRTKDLHYGWLYLRDRPGLAALLLLSGGVTFVMTLVSFISVPFILSFASPAAVGRVTGIAGVGCLAGALAMSSWGGPRRLLHGIWPLALAQGSLLLLAIATPSETRVAVVAFACMALFAVIDGCDQTIWIKKVDPGTQGRLLTIRRAMNLCAMCAAYLVGGLFIERVLQPWLENGGALAAGVGAILGHGKGRSLALAIALAGMAELLLTAASLLVRRFRLLEVELPDHDFEAINEGVLTDVA